MITFRQIAAFSWEPTSFPRDVVQMCKGRTELSTQIFQQLPKTHAMSKTKIKNLLYLLNMFSIFLVPV